MYRKCLTVAVALAVLTGIAAADDLTKMIQMDLIKLGYDPGNIAGELSVDTVVAISKFQAENELEVTGEPTPQLAGIIQAKISQGDTPNASAGSVAATADPEALRMAQQACLEQRAASAKPKKKSGFGSLLNAVSNTSRRYGSGESARRLGEVSRDVNDATATIDDYETAAKDLGLGSDDIEACRHPAM